MTVAILGCGYTGRVVARRLAARGVPVVATTRSPERLRLPGVEVVRFQAAPDADLSFVPTGARIVYSIPTLHPEPVPAIAARLSGLVERVVYLSTTGVYGDTQVVDHSTPAAPSTAEARARVAAEREWQAGPWSCIVLRPAAIYGPGRGVHVSMAERRFRLGEDGANFVSRIHVEDLASHVEAALIGNVTGVWPVADEHPCTALEIAEYCSRLLGVPMPERAGAGSLHRTRRANRRVDGSEIRRILGITLKYPSYREGIPASMGEPK